MLWSHAVTIELGRDYKWRSTAQHGTARHSTAQHSTAQHSTAQHSTAQHSTAHHSTAKRSHLTRPDFLHSEANFSHVWVSSAIGSTSVRTDSRACHTSTFLWTPFSLPRHISQIWTLCKSAAAGSPLHRARALLKPITSSNSVSCWTLTISP